jgi:choline kinase
MSANAVHTAVILAAGRGNRISAVGSTPKPLLPLSGHDDDDTFLDFHLRQLAGIGVQRIVIVGNTRTCNTALRAQRDLPTTVHVQWVMNPTEDLSTSGSAHSLQFAWHGPEGVLDEHQHVLFMDADIVYTRAGLLRLCGVSGERSATLVAPRTAADSEEVVVFASSSSPHVAVRHGKGLHGTQIVGQLVARGEATGIVRVAPRDHGFVRSATDWAIACSTAKARSEHEDITQLMMTAGLIDIVRLDEGDLFMEVDTPADYARLQREVYPALVQLGEAR